MSISTLTTKDTYAGNTSTSTAYPITFKYFDTSHVSIYADGTDITNTCTFAGDGTTLTGEFTTGNAYAATVSVVAVLDIILDQPTVLQETGLLPAKTVENDGFDRLNMQIRRAWRWAANALRFDNSEGGASTGTASTVLGFDSSGDIEEIDKGTFLQASGSVEGQVPVWDTATETWIPGTTSGLGDMLESVYDPTAQASDAYAFTPAGTGAVATTIEAKLRERISPLDFGAVGDGTADDTAALEAAIAYGKTFEYRAVIDLGGLEYLISNTLLITNIYNLKIQNGKIRAHDDFVSGFAFDIVTAGNIAIDDVFIDGRDSAGTHKMDGIHSQNGSNHFHRIEGRGYPNYGIRVTGGGDIHLTECDMSQWVFTDVENGQDASRTAKIYSIETGDCWIRGCIGQYSKYNVYCTGVGGFFEECHFYNGATSGDTVTTNRQYNVFIDQFCSPTFDNCYFDNGTILAHEFYFRVKGCHFLQVDSAAFSPVCFELAPQTATEYLNGLHITDCSLVGSLNAGADPLTQGHWITINKGSGDFVPPASGENNPIVKDNTYHFGAGSTIYLPTTHGSIEVRVHPSGNATATEYEWKLDGSTYRLADSTATYDTVDVSNWAIFAEYLNYTVSTSVAAQANYSTARNIWFQKVAGVDFELILRCDTDTDNTVHVIWDGTYRKSV